MWEAREAEIKTDPWLGQLVNDGTINLDKGQGEGGVGLGRRDKFNFVLESEVNNDTSK